jgi:hypothetical protein
MEMGLDDKFDREAGAGRVADVFGDVALGIDDDRSAG